MSSFLVTGAAGFIGSALSKRLKMNGHNVVTIDDLSTGYMDNIPKGVEFVKGDCADEKIYNRLENYSFDAIFHFAGQSSGEISFDNPSKDLETNTKSTLLLIEYALKIKCKRIIYASSMSVYGEHEDRPINEKDICSPVSFYGVGKLASENYLQIYKSYGIVFTSLRLFNVYGPGQNLANLRQGMVSIYSSYVWRKKPIIVKGSLKRFRNYQYIDDVIDILSKTILKKNLKKNEIFNLTTGKAVTVNSLIKKIIKINKKKKYKVIVKKQGTPGDSFGWDASNKYLRSKFPKIKFTSLDEGLKKYFQWIDSIPQTKNLLKYHPLKKKI